MVLVNAKRAVIDEQEASVGSLPKLEKEGEGGGLTTGILTALYLAVSRLMDRFNGKISLGTGAHGHRAGNLDAEYINWHTPVTADEEFEVPHHLGRIPIGYEVVSRDKPVVIYDSRKQFWTPTRFYVKSSSTLLSPDADAEVVMRVY